MRLFSGKKSVMDEALGDFANAGFKLEEIDDHILRLTFKGATVAHWTQTGATFSGIQNACKMYLRNLIKGLYEHD